jgi:hypothetical protein
VPLKGDGLLLPIRIAALLLSVCPLINNRIDAQTTNPSKSVVKQSLGAYSYLYRTNLSCGTGASTSDLATKPTVGCGAGISLLGFMVTEIGVMGPQAHHSNVSGYLSQDVVLPVAPSSTLSNALHGAPLVIAGYTRMFETGHAVNFGVGFERHIDESHSLQFEILDYLAFANPQQHNVMLRVGWVTGIPD